MRPVSFEVWKIPFLLFFFIIWRHITCTSWKLCSFRVCWDELFPSITGRIMQKFFNKDENATHQHWVKFPLLHIWNHWSGCRINYDTIAFVFVYSSNCCLSCDSVYQAVSMVLCNFFPCTPKCTKKAVKTVSYPTILFVLLMLDTWVGICKLWTF